MRNEQRKSTAHVNSTENVGSDRHLGSPVTARRAHSELLGAGGAWASGGPMRSERSRGTSRRYEAHGRPLESAAARLRSAGPEQRLLGESLGYVLAGIIGIAFTAGAMYILTKLLTRRTGPTDPIDLTFPAAVMTRTRFLDKTLLAVAQVAERSFFSEEHAG